MKTLIEIKYLLDSDSLVAFAFCPKCGNLMDTLGDDLVVGKWTSGNIEGMAHYLCSKCREHYWIRIKMTLMKEDKV